MRILELLAPAKNLECGKTAILHGADAVYIGAPRFGARAAAGNSIDDISQLCSFAHQYGAKVYVTVNTIIYDDELNDTKVLLQQLADVKVDAVLVQDMSLLKICPPNLVLHASTQTDNRTPEKVSWLCSQGFRRVVLARELSVEEIADIHKKVPEAELEVFVHGALCVSYSGLCYASQYCFGRSANRGECAQFCRMKFDLIDADDKVIEQQRYLLSLKDMNQSEHLEELVKAGASSFKIEGRLKDVSYVKNVTAAYSERLNKIVERYPDLYQRASRGHCHYTFTPSLQKTFNRGYTSYFLHGRQSDIASFDTPKAMGEFVGTVKEIRGTVSFNVAGTASFANGDGLCFINQNRELVGFRVNRVEGNRLFPLHMPESLHAGVRLYRNNDQAFERLLSHSESERKIGVTFQLRAVPDGFSLGIDGVTVTMPIEHQLAEKPQRENIIRQLSKLGGTPYECLAVDMPDDFNYFIPSSQLAELRRLAIAAYSNASVEVSSGGNPTPSVGSVPPAYAQPYYYNASNQLSKEFYLNKGVKVSPAFEQAIPKEAVIMQCRHCLRFALGYCVKNGGRKPQWREPLSLRLGDGRRFRLEFDCRQCQMNILAETSLRDH